MDDANEQSAREAELIEIAADLGQALREEGATDSLETAVRLLLRQATSVGATSPDGARFAVGFVKAMASAGGRPRRRARGARSDAPRSRPLRRQMTTVEAGAYAVLEELAKRRIPADGVCTLATRLGQAVYRRLGIEALPVAVDCTAANADGVTVSSGTPADEHDFGHMVLITQGDDGHLIDLALGQFSWPEQGLGTPHYLVAPLGAADLWPKVYELPDAVHVMYELAAPLTAAEVVDGEELVAALDFKGWTKSAAKRARKLTTEGVTSDL